MTSITLFDGFLLPAAQGPFAKLNVYPPAALDKILKSYERRKSTPGIGSPEQIDRRVATIRRKSIGRPVRQHRSGMSAIECKEGIRMRGQGKKRN